MLEKNPHKTKARYPSVNITGYLNNNKKNAYLFFQANLLMLDFQAIILDFTPASIQWYNIFLLTKHVIVSLFRENVAICNPSVLLNDPSL